MASPLVSLIRTLFDVNEGKAIIPDLEFGTADFGVRSFIVQRSLSGSDADEGEVVRAAWDVMRLAVSRGRFEDALRLAPYVAGRGLRHDYWAADQVLVLDALSSRVLQTSRRTDAELISTGHGRLRVLTASLPVFCNHG